MREIKFRGKRVDNGEWVYGGIVHVAETYKGEEDIQECDIWQIVDEYGVGITIIPETVGQYTGLKEQNGKEIYEGDILRFYGNEIENWTVSFEYAEFIGTYDNVSENLYNLADNMEVTGNIYDNPELLENY